MLDRLFKNYKGRILAADDDPNIRSLVADILALQDYEVVSVSDGLEVLQHIKKEKFDLLILDIHMPNLEGPQALEALRLLPNGRDLGVIMLSSEKMMDTFVKVFEQGAVTFIPKPFTPAKLLQEVEAFFAQRK